jgi:mono/diheme cytochrome c family protein
MKVLRLAGIVLGALAIIALGAYAWAGVAARRKLGRHFTTHAMEFPIPFPLPHSEATGLPADSAARLGAAGALERGRHLLQSRYVCSGCHGQDFGGGVMIDNAAIGRILAPNLTGGSGGVTAGFTPADWDRIVRHGVKPDGTPALMPSEDFRQMSDRELSDIIVFIRSLPPVDRRMPAPSLGPVGKLLLATGKLTLSADFIARHPVSHPVAPPATAATVEFGRHLGATCTGCHAANLGGGPIAGGDPSWPPAANLTPVPAGLGGWTYAQFASTLRSGKRPDGTALRAPMADVIPFTRNMTPTELQALWKYLRSVPPVSKGS